jgi:hypothetical protein
VQLPSLAGGAPHPTHRQLQQQTLPTLTTRSFHTPSAMTCHCKQHVHCGRSRNCNRAGIQQRDTPRPARPRRDWRHSHVTPPPVLLCAQWLAVDGLRLCGVA